MKPLIRALLTLGVSATSLVAQKQQSKQDFLAANLNTAVKASDDFFEYANGGWLKHNPIPASESNWGIGKVVNDQLNANLRGINERAAAAKAAKGSDTQKLGDFWSTAMDTAKANHLGIHPLDAELAKIDAANSVKDVLDVAFGLKPLQVTAFCSFFVAQDEKNSEEMSAHLYQGGLGLPDRDFYFNPDSGVAKMRDEYLGHITRTLKLSGKDDASAAASAKAIMGFETALAKASRKLEDLRDPNANYNKMSPADLTSKTPSIVWSDRIATYGLRPTTVIVGQPEFFTALDSLINSTPVPVLKDYLRFHLVADYSEYLSKAFDDEQFRFNGKVLNGQKEQRPRWKRVLDTEDQAIGMIEGRLFVTNYFTPTAKQRYADMVEAIRTVYRDRIQRLEWMSDSTKAKALQKLTAVTKKVGYPDKWKDCSALDITRDSYASNVMAASRWAFNDMVSKFGKPVDRTEWGMTPQTYNAYYNPSNNEIVLPAAIFTVPGVPDSLVDDAVAYGLTGASTIGHEITHGFDDEGRQFDAAGNLTDWWTAEDAKKFEARADVMVKQFNSYEPLPGMHINGKASLGENIADYGGILLGFEAFKKTQQYKEGKLIGGLTPAQRYFLGYALGWLSQQRDERLRRSLLSDVHAPAKWRVLGPMSNIPEFYEAFGVKQGDPMWRPEAERVRIW